MRQLTSVSEIAAAEAAHACRPSTAGEELKRADEVLIKLKRGGRYRSPGPPPSHDAPTADEFLRQLDRAALRLKPDPGSGVASAYGPRDITPHATEHRYSGPAWGREYADTPSSPAVALTWSALPPATRFSSSSDEELTSVLLCEDCRRLGVRLLRVAAATAAAGGPPGAPAVPAPITAPRDVSTMVDRLRDMAVAVGEMQAALGRGEGRSHWGGPPRLKLARFSEE